MPAINTANKGRLINFITGITGVAAGGAAVVNLPVNQRYHRLNFLCSAINYTGGTGLATLALTGAGNDDLTVTPTIVNGVPTAIAVVAGGTGYTSGDTVTMVDATGTGFVGTVTAAAGIVSAVAVTVAGTASPITPASFFNEVKLLVNGVNMRDISATDILKIANANQLQKGIAVRRGQLPIHFSPPWRNQNPQNEVTSWDLFGQSSFQAQFSVSANVSLPSLTGTVEFDYQRNVRPAGANGAMTPFLQPTAQHSFDWPIVAGRNDINQLPYSFPISRLWLQGSTPGGISQVEIYQDGNKVLEVTREQMQQHYGDDAFWLGQPNYIADNWAATTGLRSAYNQPVAYDAAFIADPDGRWWKALKVQSNLIVRVYSDTAQTLRTVMETLPGAFA